MLILFFLCSTSGADECLQLRAVTLLPVHLQIHPARLRGVLPQGAPAQMVQRLLPLPVMCMRNQHECNKGCKFFFVFSNFSCYSGMHDRGAPIFQHLVDLRHADYCCLLPTLDTPNYRVLEHYYIVKFAGGEERQTRDINIMWI
jgi:hypothetical protein